VGEQTPSAGPVLRGSRPATVHLLLLDDHDARAERAGRLLAKAGPKPFKTSRCSIPADGLEPLKTFPGDAVLLGLERCGPEGLDTISQIVETAPDLPLVVLSAAEDEGQAIAALARGAQDCLCEKQLTAAVLERSIRYAIECRRFQVQLKKAHERWDGKAGERTAELAAANRFLRKEIAEHVRAQEGLKADLRLLRCLIDSSPDLIYVKDAQSRFLVANRQVANHMGASDPQELLGKTDFDFYPWELSRRYFADEQTVIRSGRAMVAKEEFTVDNDGCQKWISTTKTPFRDEQGEVAGLVGIGRDITAQKRAQTQLAKAHAELELRVQYRTAELSRTVEELTSANQELDAFVHLASHDLQEPVRTLVSYCTLLVEDLGGDLGGQAARDLHYITDAANHMRALVQDLLVLSRAGRSAMQRERLRLNDCVETALALLQAQIKASGARVTKPSLPEVTGDRVLLTQLYQNLLSNAIKFTDKKTPSIELTAEKENGVWTLGVRDDGIGLKPEHAGRIFAPFRRLHARSQYEGTGIGLAICRKAVERHGGRIWVESQPGQGAHFRFTLPAGSFPKGDEHDDGQPGSGSGHSPAG